jgi:hypothetical protein
MKHTWLRIAFAFALASPLSALAQDSTPTRNRAQDSSRRQEQQIQVDMKRAEAVNLVVRTAAEAPQWNDKRAAVLVLTDAADLVWDDTPDQGAKWLGKAWELIEQVSDSPRNEKLKEFFTRSERTELRTAVLNVARRHDGELADKFLKQLSQNEPNEKNNKGAFDDRTARSEQLLQMAQQVVNSNPDLAFVLAERSLADGISFSLQNVLTSLRNRSVELANRLFDLALLRFSSGAPDPSEAEVLAGYLFQSGFTFSTNSNGQTILVVNPAQQNLAAVALTEPRRAKGFLIAVYEVLLTRPVAIDSPDGKLRAQQILVLAGRLAGQYDAFAPELGQAARGFLAELRHQILPEAETGDLQPTTRTASANRESTKHLTNEEIYEKHISDLEEKADKQNNPIARKLAYVEAAVTTNPDDYQRGKRIAEKIEDDDLRSETISFLLYRGALFLVDKGKTEKAAEIVPQISDVPQRAVIEIIMAQRLLSSKSEKNGPGELSFVQQSAFSLLNDVDRDLKKAEPTVVAAKILLGKTTVLAKLDRDQAVASLGQAIQMINRLDKFDIRDGSAPNLGLSAFSTSGATVASPRIGFDLRSAIEPLLNTNFEELLTIVETFTAQEIRGIGRVEIAKLYLKQGSNSPQKISATRAR